MADFRLLALLQTLLTSTSSEEPLLGDEVEKRLIASGITIDSAGKMAGAKVAVTSLWTPIDSSGAALTLTSVTGYAIKLFDELVIAAADLTYPVTADGSATAVGGLPFMPAVTTSRIWGGFFTIKEESTAVTIAAANNGTTVGFYSGTGVPIVNSAVSGDRLRFVVIYRTGIV